jgi:transposase
MVAFFEKLAPTEIAIEACGASHQFARLLQSLGRTVKLIAPQLVKRYVKSGKNDAADAESLCEAISRPTMRFRNTPPLTISGSISRYHSVILG